MCSRMANPNRSKSSAYFLYTISPRSTNDCYGISAAWLKAPAHRIADHVAGLLPKGKFEPRKFEDQYEDALKDLIRKKQKGEKIERPTQPERSNVINLMDALRQSVSAERGTSRRKAERSPPRATKRVGRTSSRHRKAG